jgi:phosphotransferase system HPr (HPr) family protein
MKRDENVGRLEKKFVVRNKLGLHARPAAVFVELASKFESDIFVRKGDTKINGKSIMGLMMLAAGEGTRLVIEVEGHDAKEAIREIEKLFENNFNE